MNDCIDSCSSLSRLPLWVVGGILCLPARLGAYFTVLGSMSCYMWHMFCTHNQYMFYTILTHFTPGIRISTQNLHSFNNERAIKQLVGAGPSSGILRFLRNFCKLNEKCKYYFNLWIENKYSRVQYN